MKKLTGSYYTPKKLTSFIVGRLRGNVFKKNTSILEPSVGDGVFIDALKELNASSSNNLDLTIVDINPGELTKAVNKAKSCKCFKHIISIEKSFLSINPDLENKYSLILGNPPYIKKKSLSSDAIGHCERIHRDAGLSNRKINNIWTAFVVSCTQQLRDDGVMALVLPADLLQVKYAEEIRVFLEENFLRLEIFALDVDAFPDIEQQTIVLFAFKKHISHGTFFFKISDYDLCKAIQISSNGLMISQSKWTHFNLKPSEIKLLNSINEKLPRISDFVDVRAGIVTGANKFFILSENDINKNGAEAYSLRILRNSSYIKKNVDFTLSDFNKLAEESKPSYLLDLSKKTRTNKKLDTYLNEGENLNLHKRYKCSLRDKWFEVPNIGSPSEAFFFKRTHLVPKVIRNVSKVYVTDSAYKINTINKTEIRSFVRSFYTVITFIYAELMGRKYGGGVLELTPNEFKNLPILYWEISGVEYKEFSKNIVFNSIDKELLQPNLLKSELGLTNGQLVELENIYSRLISTRIR